MTSGEFPVKSLISNNDDLLLAVAPEFFPLMWSHWHPCLPPQMTHILLKEREFLQDCRVLGPG
ncbi:hypothetical protein DSO57_1025672 [Entomophthora muscae]|uniref:Uncharacterized protein n=1 Tax=Entomophthora muscae TaxID=34485 RepID=A0ACC2T2C0_9FUNG|nr:hypothetical protein DSO57_1025672 [Entomophthora muscae]